MYVRTTLATTMAGEMVNGKKCPASAGIFFYFTSPYRQYLRSHQSGRVLSITATMIGITAYTRKVLYFISINNK